MGIYMFNYNTKILSKITKNLENCVELLNQEGAGDMNTQLNTQLKQAVKRKQAVVKPEQAVTRKENKDQVSVISKKIEELLKRLTPISKQVIDKNGDYYRTKLQMNAEGLNNVEDVKKAVDLIKGELSQLQKEAIKKDEEIRDVDKELAKASEQNKLLTSLSENFKDKISNQMVEMNKILESVEKKAGKKGESLKLNEIKDDLDGLLTLIGGKVTTVEDVTKFKKKVTDFLNRKNKIAEKLNDLKKKIPLLLKKFNKVIDSKEEMKKFNTTTEQVSEFNLDITELNKILEKTQKANKKMKAENDSLSSDSNVISKKDKKIIGKLNTRMGKMKNLISSVNLNTIEKSVDKLSKTVDDIETKIDSTPENTKKKKDKKKKIRKKKEWAIQIPKYKFNNL